MTRILTAAVATAILASATAADVSRDDAITFEQTGQARRTLNEMSYKPFPDQAWDALSEWSADIDRSELDGKPVLFFTFASFYRPSTRAIPRAKRLLSEYEDLGLVVIGVHDHRRYEDAPAALKRFRAEFPIAKDAGKGFRAALLSDQDPDFYIVDRAGHLRFADVDAASLEQAVRIVVEETKEQAESNPAQLKAIRDRKEDNLRRTSGLVDALNSSIEYDVEFDLPEEEEYDTARWPFSRVEFRDKKINADRELRNKHAPPVSLGDEENWFSGVEPDLETGRIKLIYLASPSDLYLEKLVRDMEALQDVYRRDVQVILSLFKFDTDVRSPFDIPDRDLAEYREDNKEDFQRFLKKRELNHPVMLSPPSVEGLDHNAVFRDFRTAQSAFSLIFIVATDNKLRYMGTPTESGLEPKLREIIDIDPGVKARREAEERELTRRRQQPPPSATTNNNDG